MANIKLSGTNQYTAKDQRKADNATKFIGRGALGSSTERYAKDFGELTNTGSYTPSDSVFISVNGNRPNRVKPYFTEINKAIDAGATLLTDTPYHRNRPYNIGELEVADHLKRRGYKEVADGVWRPARIKEVC